MAILILEQFIGFQWDISNQNKNQDKHDVSWSECEQVFFNIPLLLYEDQNHSIDEVRMYVLGKTDNNRELFICFTSRNNLIRVISARDMSKRERAIYAKAKESTEI